MKIGLLIAATGKYAKFVPPLLESAQEFLFHGQDTRACVFTDAEAVSGTDHLIPWAHRPWPDGTLMRYHAYLKAKHVLADCDFVLAMDADMRFVGPVGTEIISDLTATQHPGFVGKRGSYEDRPESVAYVRPDEGERYYCGGVVGGRPGPFFDLARRISRAVDTDKARGLCNRDKIVFSYIKKINRLNVEVAEGQEVLLSDEWGDEVISECETTFPGLGGFASGGGPLR